MAFTIESIETTLGSLVEGNDQLEKKMGWEQGKIFKKIGIKNRYLSNLNENTENLAKNSLRKLEKKNQLNNVGVLISVTNTPSILFPSLAHFLHSSLNINENIHCLGINAGCSGFVDALIIAEHYILKQKCDVIIVTSDTYSKYINQNNFSIRPIFSDGSSATLLKYNEEGFYIRKTISSSQKNTESYLTSEISIDNSNEILMNGPQVLLYALNKVIPNINKILKDYNVKTLFAHQAGKIVLDSVIKKISCDIKVPTNYENLGNLVSSSIPFLIKENSEIIKKENQILISGFGVGLSQSHALLEQKF